jgi:copper chaperone
MVEKATTLDVQGMTCPSCVEDLRATLGGLKGVSHVEVRLRDGKVLVRHDPAVAPVERLIDQLVSAGYGATLGAA